MLIKVGHITKSAVNVFENVYVQGAKVRAMHLHEGHVALALDNTVMSIRSIAYLRSTAQAAGKWNTSNMHNYLGYHA